MFVELKKYIEVRDIGIDNKIKNTAIISYLEEVACKHSDKIGYGILDTEKNNLAWIILNWKINVLKRPQYGDEIRMVTWVRKNDKLYSMRDFEILNSKGEVICIATSRWALINIKEKKIVKLNEEMAQKYEAEDKCVYDNFEFEKMKDDENAKFVTDYKIKRNMIDVNDHVHNVFYLDIANEALPFDVFKNKDINGIEVMYKKEIKYNENVKLFYKNIENEHVIIIKSEDEKIVHSIVKYTTAS